MRLFVSRNEQDQTGATLVEFAVAVPLLFLLLFGIIEFARVVTEITTVRTAAREGARFATTVESDNYANCAGIVDAVRARAVVGDIENLLIEVAWWRPEDDPNGTPFTTCVSGDPDPDDITSGSTIKVTVTSSFNSVLPGMEIFLDDLPIESEQTRQIFKGLIDEASP